MVIDGALDLSATFVNHVDNKGGAQVHGAVYDNAHGNEDGNRYVRGAWCGGAS